MVGEPGHGPDDARRAPPASSSARSGAGRSRCWPTSGVLEPESWLDSAREQILADLHAHGPSTAREIGQRVEAVRQPLRLAEGKSYASIQGAHSRVITLLGFEGRILRARPTSWITGAYRYAVAEDWLPGGVDDADLDEAVAAAALAGSYLRRFGPVTTTDLQWWMGWTLGLTRQALADCGAVEVELAGGPGWLAPDDEPLPDPEDPSREPDPGSRAVGGPAARVWTRRPWAGRNAAGISRTRRPRPSTRSATVARRSGSTAGSSEPGPRTETAQVHLHYFEKVPAKRRREVDDRVAELKAMIGDTRFSVRFPGNIHAQLGPTSRRVRRQWSSLRKNRPVSVRLVRVVSW